jgi:hypothetical protein
VFGIYTARVTKTHHPSEPDRQYGIQAIENDGLSYFIISRLERPSATCLRIASYLKYNDLPKALLLSLLFFNRR